MIKERRKFNAAFKAKIGVEVLKEQMKLAELNEKHDLHPNQKNSMEEAAIIRVRAGKGMTAAETVVLALKMAIRNRSVKEHMIIHSDRGVQYASHEFRMLFKAGQIRQSMNRKGNCYNSVCENFFKILKSETRFNIIYDSFEVARREIFEFIEIWYDRRKVHSHLGIYDT